MHIDPIIRKIFGRVEIETIRKKIEGRKLKQTEKNYLYRSIRPKLIAADLVSQSGILKEINRNKKEDTSLIDYNLSSYGYDFVIPKDLGSRKIKKIPIEELISEILTKHSNARYIEAIPIIIIKNKINIFKIFEAASKYGFKNKLGYLIETAMILKKMPYLENLLKYLDKNKDDEIDFLAEGEYEFLAKTSPKRVRKWNLLGRFFDDDFTAKSRTFL